MTPAQRRYLRALAHPLKPVVQLGHQGLTPAVVRQIDEALERHELIKVKLAKESPVDVDEVAPEVERETSSAVAQIIGHTIVLYRRRKDKPKIELSPEKRRKAAQTAQAPKKQSKKKPPKRKAKKPARA